MSVIGSNIIAGASGTVETGYQIARSLRFNSADSAYLNRTPGTAGNRKTWTWSGWVKRSALGGAGPSLFGCQTGAGNPRDGFQFATDQLYYQANTGGSAWDVDLKATQVFRDPAAQYHIVLAADTTQATASNRLKIYVNGVQITAFTSATYPALNADLPTNQAQIHYIGASFAANYLDGYLSDVRFIDGQALTPSSFGEFDTNTGVWVPKAYTGTYGTNGFWLKFDDNSGTTATTLGKDSSGNGNNWTPNNFSVTAGVGNDSLVDTPTNYGTDTGAGGEVRGNYCTINPLTASLTSSVTLSDGNLCMTKASSTIDFRAIGTMAYPSSGKWYYEFTLTAINASASNQMFVGIADFVTATVTGFGAYFSNGYFYLDETGNKSTAASGAGAAYGATWTTNDVIGVAYDADNGTITFYKNGVSQGVAYTGVSSSTVWYPAFTQIGGSSSSTSYLNFGQRPFAYTAPSGFKALCTTNLPTPAIGASASTLASKNFDVALHTGNGGTTTVSSLNFQPDLVWIKARSNAANHGIIDSVRGIANQLSSSSTAAEISDPAAMQSFNSNGFTVANSATGYSLNTNAYTYADWCWKAGGAAVTNTAGSITSTVSANTAAGISVVGYTGNASAGATVGHGLGVAPKMIIVKSRTVATTDWRVWVAALGNARMILNDTSAAVTDNGVLWGNGSTYTAPTSSVFTISANASINTNAATHIAYCFAEVAGFSKFGSYTGNGSTDGPFVYCGFRPRFIMIKRTDSTSGWSMIDTARDTYNYADKELYANLSNAEASAGASYSQDILSNGFKIRRASDSSFNASGGTYIFAAFAEFPFQYARAR